MNRILTIFAICLMMASCQKNDPAYKAKLDITPKPYNLEFDRYEEVLFNLDTNDFQAELMNVQDRYRVFLSGDLNNLDAVQYLKDFATDPFSITLYENVKAVFSDLKHIEPVVEDVFAHFHYYYPEIELPKKAFTCIIHGQAQVINAFIKIFLGTIIVCLAYCKVKTGVTIIGKSRIIVGLVL